ncbi:MAG: succinate dehydrogenase/fumarate reductase iron-sulfur subunit [Gemmatimonadales bacterium]|nr:MAG: succinate dehydrogenase/fumarate reductase iron-sulfur subunit [Gemmatimonadales bacterium]
MKLKLHIWRQASPQAKGEFKAYDLDGVSPHMSFLDMLDLLNEQILHEGGEPVAFEHDCREGICGTCGMVINGIAHGPEKLITACQLHMRTFNDGDEIWIEPWRAAAFPVMKDLVVERAAFDRIIQSGGYISVRSGSAQDANAIPIPKEDADRAFDAAACIGCGACVAACPNASAMLFTAAKAAHLSYLPQGQTERLQRAANMVTAHDEEGFGNCTNHGACQEVCPKGISVDYIGRLNRDLLKATLSGVEVSTR